jgi:hypothetical protein
LPLPIPSTSTFSSQGIVIVQFFDFFVSRAYRYRQVQTSFREELITLVVQSLL